MIDSYVYPVEVFRVMQIMRISAGREEEYSKDVPKGSVIRTEPTTGAEVDKGSEIVLVLSKGAKRQFIVSCGESSHSRSLNISDLFIIAILSCFLLAQNRRIKDICKR